DTLRRNLGKEAPQFFAKTQMWPDDGERFSVETGEIDRVPNSPLEERVPDRLRNFDSNAFLRFKGGGAKMRSDDQVSNATQGRIRRKRLGFENIKRRGRKLSIA